MNLDPVPVMNLSANNHEASTVISWSPLQSPVGHVTNQSFFLTIRGNYCNSECHSVQLHEPHSEFTAPDGAPACEVYTFSITATYAGASYTGSGCSMPSYIHSMLPSLPDIMSLESSLKYSLVKGSMSVTFNVSFEVSYIKCVVFTSGARITGHFF